MNGERLNTAATPAPRPLVDLLPGYSRAASASTARWVASSNESWLPPSPLALEAMAASVRRANRYPSLAGDRLVAALARTLGLRNAQVAVGAGSLALLAQVLAAFAGPGNEVVYAWRSYEAYPSLVTLAGAQGVQVPLGHGHRHDLGALAGAITDRTAVVLLCNPNNPTGTVLEPGEIRCFLEAVPGHVLVVLDEAYAEFSGIAGQSLPLLHRHRNLVIVRTFSKAYALAGARAGYLLGQEGAVRAVRAVAPPFGLSTMAEAGAVAALADTDYLLGSVGAVVRERGFLHRELADRGFGVPPSGGNFLWIPDCDGQAADMERLCAAHGVSVRAFAGAGVRVTIGPRQASLAFLAALDELAASRHPEAAGPTSHHQTNHSTGGAP